MPSIFTKIINREIPANIVAEDDFNIAFLDIQPLKEGHTLVVPKKEIDYFLDLDEASYVKFHLFAKGVARAIEKAIPCARIGTAIVGLEVPHVHLHLVPINQISDINFSNPKLKLTSEELSQVAEKIRHAYQAT